MLHDPLTCRKLPLMPSSCNRWRLTCFLLHNHKEEGKATIVNVFTPRGSSGQFTLLAIYTVKARRTWDVKLSYLFFRYYSAQNTSQSHTCLPPKSKPDPQA